MVCIKRARLLEPRTDAPAIPDIGNRICLGHVGHGLRQGVVRAMELPKRVDTDLQTSCGSSLCVLAGLSSACLYLFTGRRGCQEGSSGQGRQRPPPHLTTAPPLALLTTPSAGRRGPSGMWRRRPPARRRPPTHRRLPPGARRCGSCASRRRSWPCGRCPTGRARCSATPARVAPFGVQAVRSWSSRTSGCSSTARASRSSLGSAGGGQRLSCDTGGVGDADVGYVLAGLGEQPSEAGAPKKMAALCLAELGHLGKSFGGRSPPAPHTRFWR